MALDPRLQPGVDALNRKQFSEAQALLEQYCRDCRDPYSLNFLKAKMHLIEVYQKTGQHQQAIALCQTLMQSEHPKARNWARRMLPHLGGEDAPSSTPPAPTQFKSTARFKQYYEGKLLPVLRQLERQRKTVLLRVILLAITLIALLIGLAIRLSFELQIFYFIIGGGIIWLFCLGYLVMFYQREFKEKIIREIVAFISPSFRYTQENANTPSRGPFIASRLFAKPHRFSEEDCVEGTWNGTALYFSEIEAERRVRRKNEDEWRTIFNGLFFRADFNKPFHGYTVVRPDFAEKHFGAWGQMLQSANKQHASELIKLEDPEFERLFVVYGDDQIEARYILSTSLMQQLVEFRHKVERDLYVAFIDNTVYIAIPYQRNLFEPRLLRTVVAFEPVLEYFETLQLMIGIVDDLKLNRRIWQS